MDPSETILGILRNSEEEHKITYEDLEELGGKTRIGGSWRNLENSEELKRVQRICKES